MTGIAVILHSVKHPRNNVKHPGISDTFHVKMVALKQLKDTFSTRPSDLAQIWHACADRNETGSHLNNF